MCVLDSPTGIKTSQGSRFVQYHGEMKSSRPDPASQKQREKDRKFQFSAFPKSQIRASKGEHLVSPLPGEGLSREIKTVSEKGTCTDLAVWEMAPAGKSGAP